MSVAVQASHRSHSVASQILELLFRERPSRRALDSRDLPDSLKRDIGLLD